MRGAFPLDPDVVHMASLLLATNPRPVREAIDRYRDALDANPAGYLEENNERLQRQAIDAAAEYLGAESGSIALTDSTTMGLGLVYNGLRLRPGDEVLTTPHDYYATHESLRLASASSGARVRDVALFSSLESVTEEEIVTRLVRAVTPATRAVAVTWVHSGTGLKIPVAAIGEALSRLNASRSPDRRVLLCVDGVHGFGVENVSVGDLRCDFFMAGAHKWMFGPRGTGILWGSADGYRSVRATIPSFMDDGTWQAWMWGGRPEGRPDGRRMSPGGFKPFEHQWALKETFEFHRDAGKERIEARTHALASQLKEGLASIGNVRLVTPRPERLSSGIVCFDVDGMNPGAVVAQLRERKVVATVTPYATPHARLTPSIVNTAADVEAALDAVRAIA